MYVGLSEEVSYLPDFLTMVCKDGPFMLLLHFVLSHCLGFVRAFVCICFSSLVMICFGNLLLLAMSCILIRSVVLFSRVSGRAVILYIPLTLEKRKTERMRIHDTILDIQHMHILK